MVLRHGERTQRRERHRCHGKEPREGEAEEPGEPAWTPRPCARFAGVGFPGETYVIDYWKEGDKVLVQAKSKERDAKIISTCAVMLRA